MTDKKYDAEGARLRAGFTALPNVLLRQPGISGHVKALYAAMLDLAWRGEEPELPELAALIGLTEKPCRGVIKEMIGLGLVTMRRRGLGLTNAYTLHEPGEFQNGRFDRSGTGDAAEQERADQPIPASAHEDSELQLQDRQANACAAEPYAPTPFDHLARVCGIESELVLKGGPRYDKDLARETAVALASIRKKSSADSDDQLGVEIQLRATLYVRKWPNIELTPSALAKHWNRIATTPVGQRATLREFKCAHCPNDYTSQRALDEHVHIQHPEQEETAA